MLTAVIERRTQVGSLVVVLAIVAAACGGDSTDSPTTAPGPSSTTTTTTTSGVLREPTVPSVLFDGASCGVSDGALDPGLKQVSVLNTSSNGSEALLGKLTTAYGLDEVAADVAAGRFDRWGQPDNDNPTGFEEINGARMPQNATEPTLQPFTATTGTWAVVCLDFLDEKAYIAADVIEVG